MNQWLSRVDKHGDMCDDWEAGLRQSESARRATPAEPDQGLRRARLLWQPRRRWRPRQLSRLRRARAQAASRRALPPAWAPATAPQPAVQRHSLAPLLAGTVAACCQRSLPSR